MKRSLSLSLLAAVGIALLIACGPSSFQGGAVKLRKGKRGSSKTVVSFIVDDASKQCVVSEGVGTLGASGSKKEKIVWLVSNYCANAMYVAITHYQLYKDPDDPSSGVNSTVDNSVVKFPVNKDHYDANPIATGAANEVKIDNFFDKNPTGLHSAYKYWICVSDKVFTAYDPPATSGTMTCLDPDADVWP